MHHKVNSERFYSRYLFSFIYFSVSLKISLKNMFYKQKKKRLFLKTILLPKLNKTRKADILPNSVFTESIFLWFRFVELFPPGSEAGIILLSQRMGMIGET